MVPTMILIGLVVGFMPKPWCFIGFVVASIAWPLLLLTARPLQPVDVQSVLGEMAFAAANVGFAVLFVRRLILPLATIARWVADRDRDR